MEKIDPHNRRILFEKWKTSEITDISKKNVKLLREFISDLEIGANVGGEKGNRSPGRLLANISQLRRVMKFAERYFKVSDITKITEKQLHQLFLDIESGKIKKDNGDVYSFTGDIKKRFKVFWHWWMKVNKKRDIIINDITLDLKADSSKSSKFVYFTKEQLEKMIEMADRDIELKTFMIFLYDTGIRSPTEAINTRVIDFADDFKYLTIREEVSKTFERKIRLMFCSEAIKKYVLMNNLKDEDLLFTFKPETMNKKLRKIGKKVLGDEMTLGKKRGNELAMYDFRHSSVCFWLPRYKVRSQLLYRFGWRQEKQIHYYSNLLGMSDGITEEDMLISVDRTAIEKELIHSKEQINELKEQNKKINRKLENIEFANQSLQDYMYNVLKVPRPKVIHIEEKGNKNAR